MLRMAACSTSEEDDVKGMVRGGIAFPYSFSWLLCYRHHDYYYYYCYYYCCYYYYYYDLSLIHI